ncbi:helix-turn-helix transcriptional regulator [Hafnia paralvei]|uniref:helix-turn-helix domain-containing protein n=1 Tax=Hafnia paralvei TaxID=546367 RepID=UPI00300C3652
MSSSYGEKLKAIRVSEGLTQPAFSELTGVSLGAIRNYETGQRDVGLSIIDKVINHPRFEKYMMWLMSNKTSEAAGQISPALSPNGQEGISSTQKDQKVG